MENSFSHKLLLTLFVIVFIALGYLFFSNYQLMKKTAVIEQSVKNNTQASVIGMSKTDSIQTSGIKELNGTVTEVGSSYIKILTRIPLSFDTSNPSLPTVVEKTYTVKITKDTVLNSVSVKDFNKKTSLANAGEIMVSNGVIVKSDEYLQDKFEFIAKEITLVRQ